MEVTLLTPFAHIPGPSFTTFVFIDDQFYDCYIQIFVHNIDREKFLPVLRSLQVHPESGRMWESIINHILNGMGLTNTTHDRTIFRAVYKPTGETIYLIRQVDDFLLSYYNESISKDIYVQIGHNLIHPSESDKPLSYLGLATYFNRIYVEQSREYIQITCPK